MKFDSLINNILQENTFSRNDRLQSLKTLQNITHDVYTAIKKSAWFGLADYNNTIKVSQDFVKLLQNNRVCDTVEEFIEMEPYPYKGGFVLDELGFAFGATEEEVKQKLDILIDNESNNNPEEF